MPNVILDIQGLSLSFKYKNVFYPVTRDVSFQIHKGEILGLVGESGSGKSVTAKAILRLLPANNSRIDKGRIWFEGNDILQVSMKDMYNIRGNRISMIFQEPMTSLNPVFKCGDQIMESIRLHQGASKKEAQRKACDLLKMVGIPMPDQRMNSYPHELSGGMRQRVMIAMALASSPALLLADEPTTALDPTIQAQIMDLLTKLRDELNMAILYISHDLGVIAENCNTVGVMYAGAIMEIAEVCELFENPIHPYTKGLLDCIPDIEKDVRILPGIQGNVPHLTEIPKGCPFCTRCQYAKDMCFSEFPELQGSEHKVRCHFFAPGVKEA